MSVVLPEPFAPTTATTSPRRTDQVGFDDRPAAVADHAAGQLDRAARRCGHGHGCPARRVARLARMIEK